jgi:hypothetical protein
MGTLDPATTRTTNLAITAELAITGIAITEAGAVVVVMVEAEACSADTRPVATLGPRAVAGGPAMAAVDTAAAAAVAVAENMVDTAAVAAAENMVDTAVMAANRL